MLRYRPAILSFWGNSEPDTDASPPSYNFKFSQPRQRRPDLTGARKLHMVVRLSWRSSVVLKRLFGVELPTGYVQVEQRTQSWSSLSLNASLFLSCVRAPDKEELCFRFKTNPLLLYPVFPRLSFLQVENCFKTSVARSQGVGATHAENRLYARVVAIHSFLCRRWVWKWFWMDCFSKMSPMTMMTLMRTMILTRRAVECWLLFCTQWRLL